jgi:hypothetical protein
MQQRIAKVVLKDLQRRGWTAGQVITVRKGVFGIEITSPRGERCHFEHLDDVRVQVKLEAYAGDRPTPHKGRKADIHGRDHGEIVVG